MMPECQARGPVFDVNLFPQSAGRRVGGASLLPIAALLVAALLLQPAPARGADIVESSIASRLLGRAVPYQFWSPTGQPGLPLVIFLHGLYDRPGRFVEQGALRAVAERIEAGTLAPLALAFPDAGTSFYVDAPAGEPYERFLLEEFLPQVEKEHAVGAAAERRVLLGLSMGGYGALKIALRHPQRFAGALAFSPMLVSLEQIRASEASGGGGSWSLRSLQRVFGSPIDAELYRANDPLTLAAQAAAAGPFLYVAAGSADRYGFQRGAQRFAELLAQRGRRCELHILPAGHGWELLEADLSAALDYLAEKLSNP